MVALVPVLNDWAGVCEVGQKRKRELKMKSLQGGDTGKTQGNRDSLYCEGKGASQLR